MLDKNGLNNTGREYTSTKLVDTLKAGHTYMASMYISRANYVDYAVASVGMLFTDTATILPASQSFISANPQVKNTTLLTDTANWVLIQDTFIANGNEIYLTLGNFNTSATSDSVFIGNPRFPFPIVYYYIDNVSVYDVATMGIEQTKNKEAEVSIYPNPAADKVYIETTGIIESKLFDLLGKEIINTQKKEVDVSNLQDGIYFLSVKTSSGVLTKKIIVQR